MLRSIWRPGVDWDQQVKVDENKKWVNEIMKLSSITIPRCISPGPTEGVVDASDSRKNSRRSFENKIDPSARAGSGATGRSTDFIDYERHQIKRVWKRTYLLWCPAGRSAALYVASRPRVT
ncbi:hypothetical protein EVAR_43297_1 [Eumeta japonica]|uniref:Uncharacterized protein n=1 Tax=Eumeta variegata TaxID=151549 RepID=A0A4C1WY18_EUMVA|nr:hypothetical protein EVAR_43297_1 [Eumeta japonica]